MLAIPFLRPNVFGESLSVIGFGLLCAAAALSLLNPPVHGGDPHAAGPQRTGDPIPAFILCLGLAYLWLAIRGAATDPTLEARPALQGLALTVLSLAAFAVVCRDPRTRLAIGRGFVLLVAGLCASYVVTALFWAVAGVGNGQIATIVYDTFGPQPVYFPFTPTVATQAVFGIELPRFAGIGREAGWMAMYCVIAYFLTEMVGLPSRRLKLVIVVGLIGTVSTAGFGVFVVVWAYHNFLRDRGGISLINYFRQIGGIVAMAAALWLATTAPVLGLSAKSTQNAGSLDERRLATEAGVRALFESPLGGPATEVQGGINLISDIGVSGLPFVVLVCVALLLPVISQRGARFGNAIVLVVFLTMLTSQPAKDSTWAFGLVILAAACRKPDMDPLRPARSGDDDGSPPPDGSDGKVVGVDLVHVPRTIGGRS